MRNTRNNIIRTLCLSCLLGAVLFAVCILGGCSRNNLKTPGNIYVDRVTQTLHWDAVKNAGYYTISIEGAGEKTEKDSSKNSLSLESLEEGDYVLRVKAIAGRSSGDVKNSGWSEKIDFTREHETGLVFSLIDKGNAFEVSGLGSASGDITVPDEYRGKPVTKIGAKAFYNKSALTSVTLGENIREIGDQAFTNCSFLTSVNLPSGLKVIGKQAFQSCRAFAVPVSIPGSVESIGVQAFEFCRKMPSLTIGEGVKVIGEAAFDACDSLKQVKIPDSVVEIGPLAFAKCTAITELSMGAGVRTIGNDAFRQCGSLTTLTLGSGVETLGETCFAECGELLSVTMADSVKVIGTGAFDACAKLGEVTHLSANLEKIAVNAFRGTAIWNDSPIVYVDTWLVSCKGANLRDYTEVFPRTGTVGIADSAFEGCKEFPEPYICLPNTLRIVGENAFRECRTLVNVVLGTGVLQINDRAFYNCKALTKIYLGAYDSDNQELGRSSLERIGDSVFYGCESLNDISMPDSLRYVGSYAFNEAGLWKSSMSEVYAGNWVVGCRRATQGAVNIKDGTVGICNYAFYECSGITQVSIPDSVKRIGRSAFYNCKGLQQAILPSGLTVIEDYTFYHCDSLNLPILPSTLTSIGRSAFYKCRLGTPDGNDTMEDRLVIPESVKSIGAYAFYGCGYKYPDPDQVDVEIYGGMDVLILGSSLESVGDQAFAGMASLKIVMFGNNVRSIGNKAFYKCTLLENVTFGENLRTVGDKAFYECANLKSVKLYGAVESIGNYAFYKCSGLTELEIGGAREIGNYAFLGCALLEKLELPAELTSLGKQAFRGCAGLTSVVIRGSVKTIGDHAFYGCPELTIFTDSTAVAEGWSARWNSSYRPVVFSCVLSEEGWLISFVKSAETLANKTISNSVSTPLRNGYVFAGFSVSEGGEVAYTCENITDVPDGTTLWAVWTEAGEE